MINRFRFLESHDDLESFSQKADQYIGVQFPYEYLKANKVFGYFDKHGVLKGGVAFIIAPPFRVAESLPPAGRHRLEQLVPNAERDLFEVTALWLDPEERRRGIAPIFWVAIYFAIRKLRRPYFIYAYSASKPKLGEIYSVCEPREIFRGYTKILPGMKAIDDEVVEVGSVAALHKVFYKKPGFLVKRALRPVIRKPALLKEA